MFFSNILVNHCGLYALLVLAGGLSICKHPNESRAMIKLVSTIATTLAISLALVSCQPEQTLQSLTKKTLSAACNTQWTLSALNTPAGTYSLTESNRPTFTCEPDGRISGNAGVNRYFGTFVMMNNGAIEWPSSHIASTMMAGVAKLMQQERAYLAALTKTNHIASLDNKLVLSNKDRAISISFTQSQKE
ncbi:MAG: heat shock protein HslJ [Porticoccus sp.]